MTMNSIASREYRRYVESELESIAIEGIEAATIAEAERIQREREEDERLWTYLRELEAQIEQGVEGAQDVYSDVYKDLYGVRPHRW